MKKGAGWYCMILIKDILSAVVSLQCSYDCRILWAVPLDIAPYVNDRALIATSTTPIVRYNQRDCSIISSKHAGVIVRRWPRAT
jgi:hypothetical protein